MNLSKKLFLIPTLFLLLLMSSCSNDDETTGGQGSSCLADDFELTETDIIQSQATSTAILTFDVKNNSSSDYNVNTGSDLINSTVFVTTTDGSVYETTAPLLITTLAAGSTSSINMTASFGAGKTYESNTVSLFCN